MTEIDQSGHGARFSTEEVALWLKNIDANRYNRSWLVEHRDDVFHAIRLGYTVNNGLPQKATRILLDISRHILTLPDPDDHWWQLYLDAVLEALNRRDNTLLLQIYTQLGQVSLQRGDTASARHLFGSIVVNDPTLIQRPAWTAADWYLAEQKMAAYIGLITVESWDYMRHDDDQCIEDALALADRIQDQLLTQMLYHALATVYAHRKETAKAIGYALTSLAYAHKREEPTSVLSAFVALIVAYRKGRMFPQARHAIAQAQKLCEHTYYPHASAWITYERAVCDYYQQRYDSAEHWIRVAHEALSSLGLHQQLTICKHTFGNIMLEQGEYAEAIHLLTTTHAHWERVGNIYEQTSVLADLANLYLHSGNPEESRAYIEKALAIAPNIPPMPSREILIERLLAFRDMLNVNKGDASFDQFRFQSGRSPKKSD